MTSKYQEYRLVTKIGEGNFGVVTKWQDPEGGDTVAIKKILILDPLEGIPSLVIREVSLLKELEHENIVRLLDVTSSDYCIDLVFECLDLNLKEFMKAQRQAAKNPSKIKKYMYQILRGVAYCHAHKILHRDLKPENVLIDKSKDIVKIADFGLARPIGIPLQHYSARVATLYYMSPELLLGAGNYSYGLDIWAVACIFGEMFKHKYLFHGRSPIDQLLEIFSIMGAPDQERFPQYATRLCGMIGFSPDMRPKDLSKVVPGLEPAGVDLLNKMLCWDPNERISASQALEHEYFKDVYQIHIP